MSRRQIRIPIFLWICAALCVHFMLGSGGFIVGVIHDDRADLRSLAIEARELTAQEEQTFEVQLDLPAPEVKPAEPQPSKDDLNLPKPDVKSEKLKEPPKPVIVPPKPKVEPPKPKVEPPKPKTEAQKLAEKKKEEEAKKKKEAEEKKKIDLIAKKEPPKKPEPAKPLPPPDQRIAIQQHAKPNQKDNPTARAIADKANHVDKEEVATQTSHDRDELNPTPGATHKGADPAPGDSEKTHIADSEEHKGLKMFAPGEHGTDSHVQDEPKIAQHTNNGPVSTNPTPAPSRAGDSHDRAVAQSVAPAPPAPGGPPAPASPDVQSVASGGWSFNPQQANSGGSPSRNAGSGRNQPNGGGRLYTLPGLGRHAEGGSAINTNLTAATVATLIGTEEINRLREAEGERRKSEHRGSFSANKFEKYRSAIENYVSFIKPGNQTAMNTAASPFAGYIVAMHNRIHPVFAEGFLVDKLDRLSADDPLSNLKLVTRLEIVLSTDGHLKTIGVVSSSGNTAFDIMAVDSVSRAAPFGPPPEAIVSYNGNVYLHWDFHRNEDDACATRGARPYILPGPAEEPSAPVPISPPILPINPLHPDGDRQLGGPGDTRQGDLDHRMAKLPG